MVITTAATGAMGVAITGVAATGVAATGVAAGAGGTAAGAGGAAKQFMGGGLYFGYGCEGHRPFKPKGCANRHIPLLSIFSLSVRAD